MTGALTVEPGRGSGLRGGAGEALEAPRELLLRAMEQHRDVAALQPEAGGGLGSVQLLEHAQLDHAAVDVPERPHAAQRARSLLRTREELVHRRQAIGRLAGVIEAVVRARVVVAAAHVARLVAHDRAQVGARVRIPVLELASLGQGEEREQRLLDGVERVGRAEALGARRPREPARVGARESGDPLDRNRPASCINNLLSIGPTTHVRLDLVLHEAHSCIRNQMSKARSTAAPEPHDLDRAIGFWIHLVHHRARAAAERLLAPHGVTPEQWALLVRLWRADDVSQVELAGATFRDKPSVSRMIDGLEAAGYVVRARNAEDRRSHRIVLTARGRALERTLVPKVRAFIQQWTRDVPPADLEATLRTLRTLLAALDRFS